MGRVGINLLVEVLIINRNRDSDIGNGRGKFRMVMSALTRALERGLRIKRPGERHTYSASPPPLPPSRLPEEVETPNLGAR